MRIISGSARGRKLAAPPLHNTTIRPTSDRAREALFNILGRSIIDATVLDLFAGTGALGLEALSRNAKHVVFVDNNKLALALIKKNILVCSNNDSQWCNVNIIRHDLCKGLPWKKLSLTDIKAFDFIFADPPYSRNISHNILNLLNNSGLLAQNGILIIEERFNIKLETTLSDLENIDKRVYGENAFWIYQHATKKP